MLEFFTHTNSRKSSQVRNFRRESRDTCLRFKICPMSVLVLLAIAAGALLLSACTTVLNQSDCNSTDWYAKGLWDGKNGTPMDKFSQYEEDCSRYSIAPDRTDYTEGRQKGLEYYCTREQGFAAGISGHEYMSTCPAPLVPDFRAGYDPGKRLHDAEQEVKSINSSISKHKGTTADLEREIEKLETGLLQGRPDEQERWVSEKQIRRYKKELVASQLEIVEYSQSLAEAMSVYRDSVREVKELGFTVVEKY